MAILSAINITKEYKLSDNPFLSSKHKIKVLNNVSLNIEKGRCVGIVGESGSGKSTMAKIIAGVVEPDIGQILYKDQPINRDIFKAYRKNVQMIFQDPYSSLNPKLKILNTFSDIIKEHITKDKKLIKDISINALKKVGLSEEHLYRYPHQFSGGQKQRISIARALLIDPEIIIADEPVSALDVSLASQILNLLKILKNDGKTIILISHDLAVVKFICDEILVIKNGVVQEFGTNEEIFNNPKSTYTKELIESSLLKESRIRAAV